MTSTGWATRDKHDREDSPTRAALLQAARFIFERHGYARATVEDITRRAKVSRATFYVYFASKQEVFAVLAQELRDDLSASQDLPGLDHSDPRVVAEASMASYLDAYRRNLRLLTVLHHQSLTDAQMAQLLEDSLNRPLRRSAKFVRRLADQGATPAAAPEAVARAAGGMAATFAEHLVHHPGERDECAQQLGAMFVRLLGLRDAD